MMTTWQLVADTLATKFVHFKSGQTAKSRFECLLAAYENPDHTGHAHLTRSVRVLLDEFLRMRVHEQSNHLLRIVEEHSSGKAAAHCEDTIDDLLLREILQSRPFHSKIGDRNASWNLAATRLNSTQYPCEKSCKLRMQALLRVASRGEDGACELTKKQLVRLDLINSATAWNSMGSQRLDRAFGDSIQEINQLVEERFQKQAQHQQEAMETASTGDDSSSVSISSVRTPRGLVFVEKTIESNPKALSPQQRAEESLAISTVSAPLTHRGSEHQFTVPDKIPAAVPAGPPAGSYVAPERPHEEQRVDVKTLIEMIKIEREAHHRETSTMLALIQQDRVDRREEFLAMMGLVKSVVAKSSS